MVKRMTMRFLECWFEVQERRKTRLLSPMFQRYVLGYKLVRNGHHHRGCRALLFQDFRNPM